MKGKRKPKEAVIANHGDPKDGFVISAGRSSSPSLSPSEVHRAQFEEKANEAIATLREAIPTYGATATRVATSMFNSFTEAAKQAMTFDDDEDEEPPVIPTLSVSGTPSIDRVSRSQSQHTPNKVPPKSMTTSAPGKTPSKSTKVVTPAPKPTEKNELSHILFPRPHLNSQLPAPKEDRNSHSRSHSRSLSRSRSFKGSELPPEAISQFKSQYSKLGFVIEEVSLRSGRGKRRNQAW
jgi:hypothetical protein